MEPENELRYYLGLIRKSVEPIAEDAGVEEMQREVFVPTYFITAIKLPTGAIELAVNTSNIIEKIDYILEAYDDSMHLKSNPAISMQNLMIV